MFLFQENPKSEYRNSKQIRIFCAQGAPAFGGKYQIFKTNFGLINLKIIILKIVSDFEIRYWSLFFDGGANEFPEHWMGVLRARFEFRMELRRHKKRMIF